LHSTYRKSRALSPITTAHSLYVSAYLLRQFGVAVCLLFVSCVALADSPTLMRYPNIHGNEVVFEAHGNLWLANVSGGVAKQLTRGPANDMMPRFSPDGKWIAFSRSTRFTEDVYVVSVYGGEPRRLTFDSSKPGGPGPTFTPEDNLVVTWTPDSQSIVFLSRRDAFNWSDLRLYEVGITGGLPRPMSVGHAGLASFGPDGHTIAYSQVLSEFQSRKRYEGGLAPDIFTFNLLTRNKVRITNWRGTDTAPMWTGNMIYFLSDRDRNRRLNLWAFNQKTKRTREVTHFTDYDIDIPSLGDQTISFQQGGHLLRLSLPDETLYEMPIEVPDDGARTAPHEATVAGLIRGTDENGPEYTLSPDGHDAMFSARGDLFRVSRLTGATEQLTHTSDADEDQPAYSPDGARLAYTSDISGEQQIWLHDFAGGTDRMLTHFATGYRYKPVWSADGRILAVADSNNSLWLISTVTGKAHKVAQDISSGIHDAAFSSDTHWLAYSTMRSTGLRCLHLFDIETGRDNKISSSMNSDFRPSFSEDGKHLLFLSRRRELIVSAENESDFASTKATGIYVATLYPRTSVAFSKAAIAAESGKGPTGNSSVDAAGISDSTAALPGVAAGVTSIAVRGSRLFYQTATSDTFGEGLPNDHSTLHVFNLSARSDKQIVDDLDSFCVSADGGTILYETGNSWHVLTTEGAETKRQELTVGGLTSSITPRKEWTEMFNKAWRLERDLFFDPKMEGNDWKSIHDSYAKLLPFVGSRDDLNYLIGQMQGELASSHMFAFGGDDNGPDTPRASLLGVDFALDPTNGHYRLAKIYRGDASRPAYRGPLGDPSLNVAEGVYLLAVNGHELKAPENPYAALVGVDGVVTLTIAHSLSGKHRVITVTPVHSEANLRKLDWIQTNRTIVEHLSGGRIGYLYLSDFYDTGMQEFMQQFFAQQNKLGLLIDVRWNAGGHTSQWVLQHLRRRVQGEFLSREGGTENLEAMIPGPKAVIMNAFTASDGDQFVYFFRKEGLGKLVGERTWGGVRGMGDDPDLLDGGRITVPHNALYDASGHPIIENYGVDPDVPFEEGIQEDRLLRKGTSTLIHQLNARRMPVLSQHHVKAYPAKGTPRSRE
jgi:tricorn protease